MNHAHGAGMTVRNSCKASDSTFDFSSFVASQRGISSLEAEQLIEGWLTQYEPLERHPISILRRNTECAAPA